MESETVLSESKEMLDEIIIAEEIGYEENGLH